MFASTDWLPGATVVRQPGHDYGSTKPRLFRHPLTSSHQPSLLPSLHALLAAAVRYAPCPVASEKAADQVKEEEGGWSMDATTLITVASKAALEATPVACPRIVASSERREPSPLRNDNLGSAESDIQKTLPTQYPRNCQQ